MTLKNLSIGIAALSWALVPSNTVLAFEVESAVTNGEHVHEGITRDAISGTPGINSWAIESIVRGNVGADKPLFLHKLDNAIHANSANTNNEGFNQSQRFIHDQLNQAVAWGEDNSRVLSPHYSRSRAILNDLNITTGEIGLFCLSRLDPCSTDLPEALTPLLALNTNDPHSTGGTDFRALVPIIERLILELGSYSGASTYQGQLGNYLLEIKAHVSRQYLGHAFHTLQDFYSHSNVTELLYEKTGPLCAPDVYSRDLCARQAIRGNPVTRQNLSSASARIKKYIYTFYNRASIDTVALRSALEPEDYQRLETGYVKTLVLPVAQSVLGIRLHQATCPDGEAEREGFNYCHWDAYDTPGLNKDSTETHNHEFAYNLALISTEILWENFLVAANLGPELPRLDVEVQTVSEGDVTTIDRRINVSLDRAARFPVVFQYSFAPITRPNMISAIGGSSCGRTTDFIAAGGFAQINAGSSSVSLNLPVCGDRDIEPSEILHLRLADLRMTGNGDNLSYVLTIANDDIERASGKTDIRRTSIFQAPDLAPINPEPWTRKIPEALPTGPIRTHKKPPVRKLPRTVKDLEAKHQKDGPKL